MRRGPAHPDRARLPPVVAGHPEKAGRDQQGRPLGGWSTRATGPFVATPVLMGTRRRTPPSGYGSTPRPRPTYAVSWMSSSGRGFLRRSTPAPLLGQHLAVEEQLPTPNAPRLAALERAREARRDQGTGGADALGPHDVRDLVREEQLRQAPGLVAAAGVGPRVGRLVGCRSTPGATRWRTSRRFLSSWSLQWCRSENEEAAGISRRPLSPAAELVGGLSSRPVLRAQRPHVGVGSGHGEVPVEPLGCLGRPAARATPTAPERRSAAARAGVRPFVASARSCRRWRASPQGPSFRR